MLTSCQRDAAKVATTNEHNVACNNFEYKKLMASTETMHVINCKALNRTMHFKKLCISIYAFRFKLDSVKCRCSQTKKKPMTRLGSGSRLLSLVRVLR